MDQLLQWYGAERYADDLERVRRFWQGEGRVIISCNSSHAPYRQLFDDQKILDNACANLQHQAGLPGVNLPSFFPDFGTISTAKYWGGEAHFDSTGGNIFIDPMAQSVEEALKLEPLTVDDPAMDGAHGLRLYRALCERLDTDALWLRTPDFQGTLTTAGLVLNQEELLMAMYAEPEELHAFLDKVCTFLIDYAQYLRRETGNKTCGNIWPYTFFPGEMGMSFTEDLMPLLPPDLYQEFGIPYLKRLGEAFDGLHIHCCGDWGRHAANLKASGLNIKAFEFHYPATTIEEIACLADSTVFIPYIIMDRQDRFSNPYEYYRYLLEETEYRYWFALGDDEEAQAFVRGHEKAMG
ncbi:MAG: uroporphyrinogen decarboxylase/cobalamine-independent methonine synthase family protein [Armatimonadota bacterium]